MKKRYTLASAFDEIASCLRDSNLTDSAFANISTAKRYINRRLETKLNNNHIYILAAMLDNLGESVKSSEIAKFVGISKVKILGMQSVFEELEEIGLIECVKLPTRSSWESCYSLSQGAVSAISGNKMLENSSYYDTSVEELYHVISEWMDAVDNSNMDYDILCRRPHKIVQDCKSTEPFKEINELNLSDAELVILLKCITASFCDNDNLICYYQYDDIIAGAAQKNLIKAVKNSTSPLITENLLNADISGEDDDEPSFSLTNAFRRDFLGMTIPEDSTSESSSAEEPNATTPEHPNKNMFYNAEEKRQIEDLTRLLGCDNFKSVQERLSASGLRTGFACLFYGSPGTGKTETVYQLANATGREIVAVNLATVKDMYVGESEKNVQRIFDDYKKKVDESDVCPILLFNEADGIFGKRLTHLSDAVDQMQNTMQNIILQNMESFSGILIATTNLTGNLDRAFERRFLYKIEFRKPEAAVGYKIWKSFVPELSDADALVLAKEFPFSGGEIENISRKQLVESVLQGQPSTLQSIRELCKQEHINVTFKKNLLAG